jgi:two-component system phosphate regulon sensor histidine kinase PhoR
LALERRLAQPGPIALVDPDQGKQVLNSLVRNAMQVTPEGGAVTISTGTKSAEGRTWATVTVADTGIGIPGEELPHIFELTVWLPLADADA